MSQPQPHSDIRCPRCGYDLRGVTSTWSDACPLTGRCSECGLDFEWRDVYRQAEHPWLIEVHYRWKPFRSFLRTFLMTFVPWAFWRSLNLAVPVRPFVLSAFFVAVVCTWAGLRLVVAVWRELTDSAGILRFSEFEVPLFLRFIWGEWVEAGVLNWSGALRLNFMTYHGAILIWGLIFPLCFVCVPVSLRRARVLPRHIFRVTVYALASSVLLAMTLTMIDLLVLFYALFFRSPARANDLPWYWQGVPVLWIALGPWLFLGWWPACRDYLRLPHAWSVALAVVIMSGLLSFGGFTAYCVCVGNLNWLTTW